MTINRLAAQNGSRHRTPGTRRRPLGRRRATDDRALTAVLRNDAADGEASRGSGTGDPDEKFVPGTSSPRFGAPSTIDTTTPGDSVEFNPTASHRLALPQASLESDRAPETSRGAPRVPLTIGTTRATLSPLGGTTLVTTASQMLALAHATAFMTEFVREMLWTASGMPLMTRTTTPSPSGPRGANPPAPAPDCPTTTQMLTVGQATPTSPLAPGTVCAVPGMPLTMGTSTERADGLAAGGAGTCHIGELCGSSDGLHTARDPVGDRHHHTHTRRAAGRFHPDCDTRGDIRTRDPFEGRSGDSPGAASDAIDDRYHHAPAAAIADGQTRGGGRTGHRHQALRPGHGPDRTSRGGQRRPGRGGHNSDEDNQHDNECDGPRRRPPLQLGQLPITPSPDTSVNASRAWSSCDKRRHHSVTPTNPSSLMGPVSGAVGHRAPA